MSRTRTVLLDGGLGTELFRRGFPRGECLESWNVLRPEVIAEIHASYFAAGADAVTTNSLGGSRIKLAAYGLSERAYELNCKAAEVAVSARPAGRFVAGSIGPVGKFLKPQGELTESDLASAVAEQARALADGGADCLLLETHYDLREALTALRAARGASSLPVFVTMTFDRFPRGFFTLMGNTPADCLPKIEKAGASALGANCSLDSRDMADLTAVLRPLTRLPLIVQANAGKPTVSPATGEVTYSQDVADYTRFVPAMIKNGADILGGCCGTDPSYIRAMAALIKR
ncbi:MAG: homocysteine S-methyltransferase family protein [Candidatus Aminicenantes bacterium]|nr:homocysteine S-methyltransferase family protein [Candidatus Aminicenantes bacterium]